MIVDVLGLEANYFRTESSATLNSSSEKEVCGWTARRKTLVEVEKIVSIKSENSNFLPSIL